MTSVGICSCSDMIIAATHTLKALERQLWAESRTIFCGRKVVRQCAVDGVSVRMHGRNMFVQFARWWRYGIGEVSLQLIARGPVPGRNSPATARR